MTVLRTALGAGERALAALPWVSQDAARQRSSLEHTAHRPWPLPSDPWMLAQTWHDLLFAHWRVAEEELRRVVAPQLPLDVIEGSAWIGVTPFVITGNRARGTPPLPVLSAFPELNVRTYVTIGGKPGIHFLSLDADSRFAVQGARRSHRLPYFRARMAAQTVGEEVRYESERVSADGPSAGLRVAYRPTGPGSPAAPDSLAWRLTERYCLYTLDEAGAVLRADIHHRPWQLQPAGADIAHNSMTAPFRIALEGEPLLHRSARQDTVMWGPRPA